MSNDSDDDYMSDKFLTQMNDVRPGLVSTTKNAKRNIAKAQKPKKKVEHKSVKTLQQENLLQGLEKPLTSENKGFALLQKMGYKPGSALGKTGEGRSEPIGIEIKTCRTGVGHKSEVIKRKANHLTQLETRIKHRAMAEKHQSHQFQQHLKSSRQQIQIQKDLTASQKACEQLDIAKNILEPTISYYWLKRKKVVNEEDLEDYEEEDDEEEEDIDIEIQLDSITKYLRATHFYCIWCGITFDDESDMSTNCPGDTAEDHG